jgi:hypothetical protein
MKRARLAVCISLAVVFSAAAVSAAVVWHTGPNFSIQPFPDLLTTGTVSGLGATVMVEVEATGTGSGACFNPAGHLPNPFSNIPISASGSETVHVANGTADVNILVEATPGNPCPNPHWTAVFNSVTYTSAEIIISNRKGTLFDRTYDLMGCTSTGSVVDCAF